MITLNDRALAVGSSISSSRNRPSRPRLARILGWDRALGRFARWAGLLTGTGLALSVAGAWLGNAAVAFDLAGQHAIASGAIPDVGFGSRLR